MPNSKITQIRAQYSLSKTSPNLHRESNQDQKSFNYKRNVSSKSSHRNTNKKETLVRDSEMKPIRSLS